MGSTGLELYNLNRLNLKSVVVLGLTEILSLKDKNLAYKKYLNYIELLNYFKQKGYNICYPFKEGYLEPSLSQDKTRSSFSSGLEYIRPNRFESRLFDYIYSEYNYGDFKSLELFSIYDIFFSLDGLFTLGVVPNTDKEKIKEELHYVEQFSIDCIPLELFNKKRGITLETYNRYIVKSNLSLPTFLLELEFINRKCTNVGLLNISEPGNIVDTISLMSDIIDTQRSFISLGAESHYKSSSSTREYAKFCFRLAYTPYPIKEDILKYTKTEKGYKSFLSSIKFSVNDYLRQTNNKFMTYEDIKYTLDNWLMR